MPTGGSTPPRPQRAEELAAGVPPPSGSTAADAAPGGGVRPEQAATRAACGGIVFGGAQWTTVIDYPGVVASTLFTVGCNLRCPFCHNPELVDPERLAGALDLPAVVERLRERVGFLDGVVITGGEPTIHPGLAAFATSLKDLGYLVKLDTNGTRPEVVRRLLEERRADYIAMDVKAPLDRYAELAGTDVDIGAIERSIAGIVEAAPEHEFRTTVAPTLGQEDILRIAELLREAGARRFFLQPYRVPETGLLDRTWMQRSALSLGEIESAWSGIRMWFADGGVRA